MQFKLSHKPGMASIVEGNSIINLTFLCFTIHIVFFFSESTHIYNILHYFSLKLILSIQYSSTLLPYPNALTDPLMQCPL